MARYRYFKILNDTKNENTGIVTTTRAVINLCDVVEWEEVPSTIFNDKVRRTIIYFNNHTTRYIRVEFDTFDKIMREFLDQVSALDTKSLLEGPYFLSKLPNHSSN